MNVLISKSPSDTPENVTSIPSFHIALAKQLGIETEIGIEALGVAISNCQTLDKKQRAYGSGNISAFGEYGVLVRVSDKFERLKNLLTLKGDLNYESIEDSWLDLANYGLIGFMVRKGLWK